MKVRFVYDADGNFKGYGYLDLHDVPGLKEHALSLDRIPIAERPLFISEYKPKAKETTLKRDASDGASNSITTNVVVEPLFKPSFVRAKPKRKLNVKED